MKQFICCLVLLASITGTVLSQDQRSKSDEVFDLPANYAQRRFMFDLGKGNRMQIELASIDDLKYVSNIDSLIQIFLADLDPLRDSLGEDVYARKIDYRLDSTGINKMRIQNFKEKGSTFVVQNGEAAHLKLQQDTIHFLGRKSFVAKYTMRKAFADTRYYRVSFFLNNLAELSSYADGSLNKKIRHLAEELPKNPHPRWITTRQKGTAILESEPSISARLPKGLVGGGDFLNFRVSIDLQNYKNYFVPAASLGVGVILSTSHFKRDIVLSWDPNFFFAKDSLNKLKSFRNDFLTLTWGQGLVHDNSPRRESHLLFIMSLGYLIKRDGEYFEKNTFRMGGGRLSLFSGKTKIEPVIYFNNFFKGVTPGVRWIQSF